MFEPEYLTVDHLSTKEITRIFSKLIIDPVTDCWIWQGYRNPDGYGRFNFRGRLESTHRLLYAWLVAPLPRGSKHNVSHLDHEVCDNRSCVNPAHLTLKSHTANVLRGASPSAINARKIHCIRGHLLSIENDRRRCVVCTRLFFAKREQTEKRKAYKRRAYLARKARQHKD